MNITFLIGNGFDINLGLKTQYKDFYPYYLEKNQENDDLILNAIRNNSYELWADLETALGNMLSEISEDQIDHFLDDKERIEGFLLDYLTLQNKRFRISDSSSLNKELANKIAVFYKEFQAKWRIEYESFLREVTEEILFNFISFNYTSTLDKIINSFTESNSNLSLGTHVGQNTRYNDRFGKIIHIHGDLNKGIILGLNDQNQINNDQLKNNQQLNDYMIKTRINEQYGALNQENAVKLIQNSRYVCVYGMSIGDTDNIWWVTIIDWLLKDPANRLVLYTHSDSQIQKSIAKAVRIGNKKKQKFLSKKSDIEENIYQRINSQIIVVPNPEIFNFKSISIADEPSLGKSVNDNADA